jgi:capsular exopolysaccharide synthesis family protein
MSYIFDALQRSEAERAGSDSPALPGVTELLERAEHRAASRWERAVLSAVEEEQPAATESAEREPSVAIEELPPVAPSQEPPVVEQAPPAEEPLDLFGQCRTLHVSLGPQSRLICVTDSDGPGAEAFRFLAVRLRHLRHGRPLKKVLITSTVPQEGKSMVAANLACALALTTSQRTVLLEGDVRRPSQSQAFGIGKNPGLCEWLAGDGSLEERIYHLDGPNLWIMPAGSAPSNPLELLQSAKLAALMDELTARFDWVIVDSPPVLPLADTSVWSRVADGILLVTRQGVTEKRQLQKGLEALEFNKLVGAVSNCSTGSPHSSYYYRPLSTSRRDENSAA